MDGIARKDPQMTATSASKKVSGHPSHNENISKTLPIVSILLTMGGLIVLGWVGWSVLNPAPSPYHYQLVREGSVEQFPELGLSAVPDISVSKYELLSDGTEKPLVVLYVGEDSQIDIGPVLLEWQTQVNEPLITMEPSITELSTLMVAITEYLPENALVLAWWDTSRRLKLLGNIDTLFYEHLSQPLLIPDVWRERRKSIENTERQFWRVNDNATAEKELFGRFREALLADKVTGAAELRALVGNRETYLALHITDAYKLGIANPEQVGIGYKDFPNTGNLHTMSGHVKKWLKENEYISFSLEKLDATSIRVYFLTDPISADTLIAQALPFTSSKPFEIPDLSVVYQYGGYWVYKLLGNDKTK